VNTIEGNVTGRKGSTPLLSVRVNDAARAIGVSRSSIYELIGEGKLKSALIAGRRVIIWDSLQDLLRGAA
jgi:predicted DNA-binding transcriptional regulator AlpA